MILYKLGIWFYWLAGKIVAIFSEKASKWYVGNNSQRAFDLPPAKKEKKRIWFHISSLGEYEQAKPVIKGLVEQFEIIITFFSPSGYDAKNVREYTKHVFYLGKDTKSVALKNIEVIKPDFFVLVKYDFWLIHLIQLQNAKIPVILISGLFRPSQIFFKWYGDVFKKTLKGFNHFFLQNDESAKLLKTIGINQSTVNGDTRVDSVLENAPVALEKLPATVQEFVKGSKCLVVGSSYAAEEQIVAANLKGCLKNWKILIAPHNIHEKHLEQIETLFGVNARFLSKTGDKTPETQVFIIDQIGLLKYLYFLADIAFVGGGFGKTVHNTLEPAAFGIPILFGPKYQAFPEAVELVSQNGAFPIINESMFSDIFIQLNTEQAYKAAAGVCKEYILKNSQSSGFIIHWIRQFLSMAKT